MLVTLNESPTPVILISRVEKKQMDEKEKALKEELEANQKTMTTQKDELQKKDALILDVS